MQKLKEMLDKSDYTVFFGGAGVSTESGIPDFRGAVGIFNEGPFGQMSAEEIIHIRFFRTNPELFYEFYREKLLHPDAKPNKAHLKLAELERLGKLKAVITQNIDGLHQAAGSENVLEMHGSVYRNYCVKCGLRFDVNIVAESLASSGARAVPLCGCGGIIRPDVTLYGEMLDEEAMAKAARAVSQADMLIVAGTSLSVYPVAGLLNYFNGSSLVVINKTATHLDSSADLVIRESVGEVFGGI